jgi:hypothetical protein
MASELEALVLSLSKAKEDGATPRDRCKCCGAAAGFAAEGFSSGGCCALCHLVRNLERPTIDLEACLIWLPEFGQIAVNLLIREIHIRLHERGLPWTVNGIGMTADGLRHAVPALLERAEEAKSRLGTARPSELAAALRQLSSEAYAARSRLLDGVRLLPLGRLFAGDRDIYPAIVDAWLGLHMRRAA